MGWRRKSEAKDFKLEGALAEIGAPADWLRLERRTNANLRTAPLLAGEGRGAIEAVPPGLPAELPLPAALSMFVAGAGLIGLLARRRKRKAIAA